MTVPNSNWHTNFFFSETSSKTKLYRYLCNEVWFQILLYQDLDDIIRLPFISRRLNEIVYSNKRFKNYHILLNSIINKGQLYECVMKKYDELINRLSFSFGFANCLFFRSRLECLRNQFCIANVLCHLLFCSRSPNSVRHCRHCSRLFAENDRDFALLIKYYFSLIFTRNKNFNKEIELLFVQARKMNFNLDVLLMS